MNTPAAPGDGPGTTSTSNGPAEPSPDDDRTVVLDAPAEAASGEEVTMVLTAEERATLAALASRHTAGTGAVEAEQPVVDPVAEAVAEADAETGEETGEEAVDQADDVASDEAAEEGPEAAAADEPVEPTADAGGSIDPVDPLDVVDPADVTVLIRGGQDADLLAEDRTVMIQGGQYSLDKLGLTPDFAAPAPGQPEPVPPAPPVAEEPQEPEPADATPVEEPTAEEPTAEEPAAEEPAAAAPADIPAVERDAAEDTTEVLSSNLDPIGTAVEVEPVVEAGAEDQPGSVPEDEPEATPEDEALSEPDPEPGSAVTELLAAPAAAPVDVGPGDAPVDEPAEEPAADEPAVDEPAAEVPDAPAAVAEEPMAAAFVVAPPAATPPPVGPPPVAPPPVAPPSTGPAPDQESPWAAALRSGTEAGHPDPAGTDLDGTALPDEDLYPVGADPDARPADVEAALGFTDHEAIAERRRAVRRQRRQTITFLVMFGTVLMMGVAGYTYWTGLWGSANGPIKGAVACPVPTATAASAKDVSLSVLNGSEKRGLAQTVARQLQARQFSIKTIGNDSSVKPGPEAAVIRFGPSGQLQARTAAAQVAGKVRLLNDKRKDESVDLILQPGFKALNTTKVTQRLLAPPPVKSPEGCVPVG